MTSYRMEVDPTKPVFMPFASHNVFLGIHVPDLPSAVIWHRSYDLFTHVQSKVGDRSIMSLHTDIGRQPHTDRLICSWQERIWPRIFRIVSVPDYATLSKGRLIERIVLGVLGWMKLAFLWLFDLILDISLILFDSLLKEVSLFLQLIFSKLEHRFFFLLEKEFTFHFFNPFLITPEIIFHLLNLSAYLYLFIFNPRLVVLMEVTFFP